MELIYEPAKYRKHAVMFSAATLLVFIITGSFITYFCYNLIIMQSAIYKILSILIFGGMISFLLYFIKQLVSHSRHITKRAVARENSITIENWREQKEIRYDDIVSTISVSSPNNQCLVILERDDYATIDLSSVFWFIKGGKVQIDSFGKISEYVSSLSPNHIKYLKTNKVKNTHPFTIPYFVFDLEFHSKRTDKFIRNFRRLYPAK